MNQQRQKTLSESKIINFIALNATKKSKVSDNADILLQRGCARLQGFPISLVDVFQLENRRCESPAAKKEMFCIFRQQILIPFENLKGFFKEELSKLKNEGIHKDMVGPIRFYE